MKTIDFVRRHAARLEEKGRFALQRDFIQHGVCTVYDHSVQVAVLSVNLTRWIGLRVNYNLLVRAALLHDYFLYDWHLPHGKLHGFFHPKIALLNAKKDFLLSKREENTILRHMFPLTPIPPKFLEGWIVCLCDKICAIREVFKRKAHK